MLILVNKGTKCKDRRRYSSSWSKTNFSNFHFRSLLSRHSFQVVITWSFPNRHAQSGMARTSGMEEVMESICVGSGL